MKQFGIIFGFEFRNYVRSRAFVLITVLLVAGIGIALSFPRLRQAFGSGSSGGGSRTHIAVAAAEGDAGDLCAYLSAALPGSQFEAAGRSVEELKSEVESGRYDSAVLLTDSLHYSYIVKNVGMYDSTGDQIDAVLLKKYQSDTLQRLGVPAADAGQLLGAQVKRTVVRTVQGKDQMQNFFYTYILLFALYMAIMVYGQLVASSVATEKSSRAMELLITSARPDSLIFGKILGAGTAGLLQLAGILGSGYLFYQLNRSYYQKSEIVASIFGMPLSMLLYAILFFVLGFFLYAFIYGALASLVSRMEELSQTIMPVTWLFVAAFFVVFFGMTGGQVNGPLMIACSYIPFTSPMAMFVRLAMGSVAGWEVAVSVGILLLSTLGVGMLAAAVYRVGVLLYGKAPKPAEIFRVLRSGR